MAAFRVQYKAVAILLLSITLTAHSDSEKPGPAIRPPRVDTPFNLRIKSYNFNTTLYWDYNLTSVTPYFRVEYLYYTSGDWTIVESCRNISRLYCDLSEQITDPSYYYNVRVKAYVGSKASKYRNMEFSLITEGIIGPPTLNITVEEKMIVVDISHPNVPFVNGKTTVADYFDDLKYIIYYGNDTEETDNCDEIGCTANILASNLKDIYCISARGKSDRSPMTIEKSKEICTEIGAKNYISNPVIITIITIPLVTLLLAVLATCIFKNKTKAKAKVPESLSAVVRSMTPRIMSLEQRAKYDQVCISPVESPEEKIKVEEESLDTNVAPQSGSRESIDPGYQSSLTEAEQKSDDGEDGRAEEESCSNSYFHTNSSNNDDNNDSSITPESETFESNTKQEPPKDIKPLTNSCGYDKPHCPLDFLIEMSRENHEIEPSSSDDH
ncbi:interferon gamma receptor 1 [Mixophyes fleayi]|uniref:interferon gamma receptor 1 n=1 Tax=Mixophyes fleayi TaxID=3061075 RepID=UPI003F4D8627